MVRDGASAEAEDHGKLQQTEFLGMLSGIKLTRTNVELQAQKTVLLEIKRQTVGWVAASISRLKRKPRESLDVPQSACWLCLIPENWARPRSHASEAVDVVSRRHVHGIAFAFQAFDSQDSGRKQETKRRQRGSEKWEGTICHRGGRRGLALPASTISDVNKARRRGAKSCRGHSSLF